MTDPTALRVSDAERLAAQEVLRRHHLDGRLSVDEFDERCGLAARAVTRGDLLALQVDLPPLEAVAPAPRPATTAGAPLGPRRLAPGTIPFSEVTEFAAPPDAVFGDAIAQIAPAMARCGYELELSTGTWLEFVNRRRPAWTILLAVFVFPIGLLALLYREETRVSVRVEPRRGGGSALHAHGVAPLAVRRAFADLRE